MNAQNSLERLNFEQSALQSPLLPWAASPPASLVETWQLAYNPLVGSHELLLRVGLLLMPGHRYWDEITENQATLPCEEERPCLLLPTRLCTVGVQGCMRAPCRQGHL